jgi:predicted RNA methylase
MRKFKTVSSCLFAVAVAAAVIVSSLHAPRVARAQDDSSNVKKDVPYVPTPEAVVEQMLKMVAIQKDDVVYDLGCGDGRIVVAAVKKGAKKGIGVDIDPQRIKESNENAKKEASPTRSTS